MTKLNVFHRTIVRSTSMAACLFVAAVAAGRWVAAVAAQEFEIVRSTIDGGGVMRSTGGDFELSGTIGQPDVGAMTGDNGSMRLTGGFWFSLAAGDCNDDGGVNLFDFIALKDCLTGPAPGAGVGDPPCPCLDFDDDGDVDILDFAAFQVAFEGS